MKQRIEVPPTRARVIRTRVLANGRTVKNVIPVQTTLTPAEREQIALQIEWERWCRLKLRG